MISLSWREGGSRAAPRPVPETRRDTTRRSGAKDGQGRHADAPRGSAYQYRQHGRRADQAVSGGARGAVPGRAEAGWSAQARAYTGMERRGSASAAATIAAGLFQE